MARRSGSIRRSKQIASSTITEALRNTLDREFEDYATTRSLPSPDDRRGRERYIASLQRMALASPHVGSHAPSFSLDAISDDSHAHLGQHVMGGGFSVLKSKLTLGSMYPIRLGEGLYDFYPPELPPKGLFHRQPFTQPFTHQKESPSNGTLLLSVPQVGSGRFYASGSTFERPADRDAKAWCGTLLPIDPKLHNDAEGPKNIVVWAEGTITYDYELSATPGAAWNTRPKAADARVNVLVRLLRFSRQTGQLMADPDAILLYLVHREIVDASLLPNGVTTSLPSTPKPSVGGPYASWSSGPTPFTIDLPHGQARKLETDSTYQVAVICSAGLSALSGPAPASAQVSAQMFLRLVTLGVLPPDPSVRI